MPVALSRFCEKWPERRRPAEDHFLAKRKNVDAKTAWNGRPRGLMRSAQAALTAAAETVPSAEERRAEAAAAEALAASGAGDVAKTAVGVAGRLRRQWLRWLTEHGEASEYDAAKSLGSDEFASRRERGE